MTLNFTGYIEGYYGRLFDWRDRNRLLGGIAAAAMTSYFYAPKEDAFHRQFWRQPYDKAWQAEFAQFAATAVAKNIHPIAGIAPGLDFDFASLDAPMDQKNDFTILVAKARQFLANGASMIALLMDDIAADFEARSGSFTNEGSAHAALANRLGSAIDAPIIVVPRIYADSLITPDDAQSLTYLEQFAGHLDQHHQVVYCGDDIVALRPFGDAGGHLDPASVIIWDNFYANDYCPNRLFLGPLKKRNLDKSIVGHFINGTGHKETDKFLLNYLFKKNQKIPFLPKELIPIFSNPFKKISISEERKVLNISDKSVRYIFEITESDLLLEWKPYIFSALNDIELSRLKTKKEVEGFLERRYSPLFKKGLNKN